MRLQNKALGFEKELETYLTDDKGAVLTLINFDTMKPFPRGLFDESKDFLRLEGVYSDFSELLEYENFGMVNGAYLASLVWKYRATSNKYALDKARDIFKIIEKNYDLSQKVQEGFFCKPYGGKSTDQTSSDQYTYVLAGLDEYFRYASENERKKIIEMIDKMVSFWIRNGYQYKYYSIPSFKWPLERFPALLWLAWHYTGEKRFLREYTNLCRTPEVENNLPYASRLNYFFDCLKNRPPMNEYEKEHKARIFKIDPAGSQSGFLCTELLLKYSAPHKKLWLKNARELYFYGSTGIGNDHLAAGYMTYSLDNGEIREFAGIMMNESKSILNWNFPNYVAGNIKSGSSAVMFARGCVAMNRYIPELNPLETAWRILTAIDHDEMKWYMDIDNILPPEMKWHGRVYSGDAVVHWLWAYWEMLAEYGDQAACNEKTEKFRVER